MDRPSPDEIRTVRATIRNHEQEVNSIEIAMADLSGQLRQLEAERNVISMLLQMPRIAFMGSAPSDDVLILIFEHCVGELWDDAPLVISHVCAKWRRASFFPRLWSHIEFHHDNHALRVAKTHLWLSRALQSPLYVTFRAFNSPCRQSPAFELILDRASQWRALSVRTMYDHQASAILSQCRRPLPNLHSLRLRVGCAQLDEGKDEPFLVGLEEVFVDAPSLSDIRIFSNRFPPSLPQTVVDLHLSLDCMRSFCLSDVKLLTALQTLQKLQRLTLTINPQYSYFIIAHEDPVPDIYLQHLECLIICGYYNYILRYLRTPILRCLHLSHEPLFPSNKHPDKDIGKILLQFLRSSKPPIRLLELNEVGICSNDLAQCFFSLPLLEELCLCTSKISEKGLVPLHGPIGACPRLKRIFLGECKNLAGQALIDLVRSRVDSSGNQSGPSFDRIEEITAHYCALVNDSHILDLAHITVCHVVEWGFDSHFRTSRNYRPIAQVVLITIACD
ncbi:hypothetical protein BGW80DRAFT_793284 [Lactifluus volemus]|nr:hypothetical protein BGW80DRAFT_793284 [Lactifluus volemus]